MPGLLVGEEDNLSQEFLLRLHLQNEKFPNSSCSSPRGFLMNSPRFDDIFLASPFSEGSSALAALQRFLPSNNEDSSAAQNVYSSDEFRMFEFKVRRCMRGRSHDWTECPFAHPGEKARRRDPRRFHYGGAACPDFRKGHCKSGDSCELSHGVFECWLHPARYRTQPCKDGRSCKRRVCFFAHTPEQLRLPPPPMDFDPGMKNRHEISADFESGLRNRQQMGEISADFESGLRNRQMSELSPDFDRSREIPADFDGAAFRNRHQMGEDFDGGLRNFEKNRHFVKSMSEIDYEAAAAALIAAKNAAFKFELSSSPNSALSPPMSPGSSESPPMSPCSSPPLPHHQYAARLAVAARQAELQAALLATPPARRQLDRIKSMPSAAALAAEQQRRRLGSPASFNGNMSNLVVALRNIEHAYSAPPPPPAAYSSSPPMSPPAWLQQPRSPLCRRRSPDYDVACRGYGGGDILPSSPMWGGGNNSNSNSEIFQDNRSSRMVNLPESSDCPDLGWVNELVSDH